MCHVLQKTRVMGVSSSLPVAAVTGVVAASGTAAVGTSCPRAEAGIQQLSDGVSALLLHAPLIHSCCNALVSCEAGVQAEVQVEDNVNVALHRSQVCAASHAL